MKASHNYNFLVKYRGENSLNTFSLFLAHLSRSDMVSLCDREMSGIHCACVHVCILQQFVCVDRRIDSFHPIFMKFGQNVILMKSGFGLYLGNLQSKTCSLGQTIEKPWVDN